MRKTYTIFKALFLSSLKSPGALFWTVVFPVLLLIILGSIFSNVGKSISVKVALVNESSTFKGTNMDFASHLVDALNGMSKATDDKTPLLSIESSTTQKSLQNYIEELKNDKIDAVLVIPKLFNSYLYARVLHLPFPTNSQSVEIYTRRNSQSSNIAFSIVDSVVNAFNREFMKRSGVNDQVISKISYVSMGSSSSFSYVNFLVIGIIVMAFMTVALFGVTDDLLVQREKKVLRRIFVAPIDRIHYLFGMTLSNWVLELLQFILILVVGMWLGAKLSFGPGAIFYLFLTLFTTMPMGFFVASFAKSANSGNALANVFNFVFMFLGGLFFPIDNVPYAIKAIAYSIPTTYLADGLRGSMGVSPSPTPAYLNVAVPIIWAVAMTLYSVRYFKWEV